MIKLPTIYKTTKTGATQEWTVEVEDNKFRTISGQVDGKKVTTEWTLCEGKNVGKANETSAQEQALKEAEAMRKKKLEHGYFEDIKNINQKQYFEPMLAKDFNNYKDDINFPVYSQPKLDGVRCIVDINGMWSRNGKEIISAPHIRQALQPLFNSDPTLIFDGELYNHEFKNDFNTIVSLIKKTKPTVKDLELSKEKIQYHIYDLPSCKENFCGRLRKLAGFQYEFPWVSCLDLVRTEIAINEVGLVRLYGEYIDEGYEGQMIRLDKPYENKRSKYLLKNKTFQDEEFKILEIGEGIGNRTGTAGYMVFERNGNKFNSNIKCSYEQGVEILKNKELLIGKMATVKYFNLTPAGVPRFPFVINIDRLSYE